MLPGQMTYKAGRLRSWKVAKHRGKSSLLIVPNSQLAFGVGLLRVRRKELSLHTKLRLSRLQPWERNARLSRPKPVVLPVCTLRSAESTTARTVASPPRRATRARAHTHKRTHTVRRHLRPHPHADTHTCKETHTHAGLRTHNHVWKQINARARHLPQCPASLTYSCAAHPGCVGPLGSHRHPLSNHNFPSSHKSTPFSAARAQVTTKLRCDRALVS